VFLGPTGDTAEFLSATLAGQPDDADLAALAEAAVAERRAAGLRVPGLGHPVHKVEDPRTPRLYELAEQEGVLGPHLRLLAEIAAANERQSGRTLPINGAGAAGAALADLDLPPEVIRGVVLIGRTAGLVAHIAEENQSPIGMPLWLEVEGRG
jgi:citrate synthase